MCDVIPLKMILKQSRTVHDNVLAIQIYLVKIVNVYFENLLYMYKYLIYPRHIIHESNALS